MPLLSRILNSVNLIPIEVVQVSSIVLRAATADYASVRRDTSFRDKKLCYEIG